MQKHLLGKPIQKIYLILKTCGPHVIETCIENIVSIHGTQFEKIKYIFCTGFPNNIVCINTAVFIV